MHGLRVIHYCDLTRAVVICVKDQRKRRSTAIPHVIRPSTKTRRRIGARRTANDTGTSNGNMEASAETIDVVDGQ